MQNQMKTSSDEQIKYQAQLNLTSGIYREIQDSQFYIDKTDFIKQIFMRNYNCFIISRWRRSGKTSAMTMVYDFVQLNRDENNKQQRSQSISRIFEKKNIVKNDQIDIQSIVQIMQLNNDYSKIQFKEIEQIFLQLQEKKYPDCNKYENYHSQEYILKQFYDDIKNKLEDFSELKQIYECFNSENLENIDILNQRIQCQINKWKENKDPKYVKILLGFGNSLKHYQQYPVIFLTISHRDSNKTPFELIQYDFSKIFQQHNYMLKVFESLEYQQKFSKQEVEDHKKQFNSYLLRQNSSYAHSLNFLIEILYNHYQKKVIVLIDEYDSTFLSSLDEEGYNTEIIDLQGQIYRNSLKDNALIQTAIFTGLTRIGKSSIFSGLNNFYECSIFQFDFENIFGFTEDEVFQKVDLLNLMREGQQEIDKKQLKKWYNGYNIGRITVYNPFSIVHFLQRTMQDKIQQFGQYWINTANLDLLQPMYDKISDSNVIQELFISEKIEFKINEYLTLQTVKSRKQEDFLSVLVHMGYLTKANSEDQLNDQDAQTFKIPNYEIKLYFQNQIFPMFFNKRYGINHDFEVIKQIALSFDKIKDFSRTFYQLFVSKIQQGRKLIEKDFQSILFAIFYLEPSYNYIPYQEKKNNFQKFADCVYYPLNNLVETVLFNQYKVCRKKDTKSTIEDALWQVCSNQYLNVIIEQQKNNSNWKYVLFRVLVFFKCEDRGCQLQTVEFLYPINEIQNIINSFKEKEGGLLKNYSILIGQTSVSQQLKMEQRQKFLTERNVQQIIDIMKKGALEFFEYSSNDDKNNLQNDSINRKRHTNQMKKNSQSDETEDHENGDIQRKKQQK